MRRRPLYVLTVEHLEEYVEQQRLGPGDRLPSEERLAEELAVSRSTIREALRELELRGRIERIHGRGSFLCARSTPIFTGLTALESLESLAQRQGWRCGTERIVIAEVAASAMLAATLEVVAGTGLSYVERIKTRDSRPVCRMQSWLPASLISAEQLRREFQRSITELLLQQPGVQLDHAIADVQATIADATIAGELDIEQGAPLVLLNELLYEPSLRPICYNVNAFVPRAVRLEVLRRVPSLLEEVVDARSGGVSQNREPRSRPPFRVRPKTDGFLPGR